MPVRILVHHPLAEFPEDATLTVLRVRGCAGETTSLSFGLVSLQDRNVEIRCRGLGKVQAWVVNRWEQPGLGLYRGKLRGYPELLLKQDAESFPDHYRWKRPGGMPWRSLRPYYQAPALCLEGPPRFRVSPCEPRQVWLSVSLPNSHGPHRGEVEMVDRDSGALVQVLPVELEVLPFTLDEPAQDRMLWYRGTLDESQPQHHVTLAQMEVQLRDIRAHGFCSITVCERTRRNAQTVIDLARKTGFDRHVVLLAPYPRGLLPLRYGGLTPLFYLSDELDGYGPEVLHGHRYNLAQVRRYYGAAKTMASLLSPTSLQGLEEARPDLVSYSVTNSAVWLHSLTHFRESYPRPVYYYWACHLEKPALHRLLAGLALWHSGADGISPYCYQHLPVYPSSPFRDQDPWEPGFHLSGVNHEFRQHMTTYPARGGTIPTVQWEGLREGILDLKYLTTWERLLKKIEPSHPLAVRQCRRDLEIRLKPLDLRRVRPADSLRDPWPDFRAAWLDDVRDQVIDDILRLREKLM